MSADGVDSEPGSASEGRRVAVLTPTGRDGALTARLLADASIECVLCGDLRQVEALHGEGVGALLVAEEAIAGGGLGHLAAVIARQPPWSDLPVLLLTRRGADSATAGEAIRRLGNVTLLERPVRPAALVSSVRAALKARRRQYEVARHIAEQERSQELLRDADRRKDEFLATLAHELRNPLAPIDNGLEILRMIGSDDPDVREIHAMMERQVRQLVRLVGDLMEVSRITRGKVELQLEQVSLVPVIRSAVETSQPLIAEAGHRLEVALPDQPLHVHGDPVRLSQIFSNLLNNAAKYTDAGGEIRLVARAEGPEAVVAVRDTGVGIEKARQADIFAMFTQLDRSTRQAQGGLGIGLTLVRTLTEMHGGGVSVHSDGPGTGSEFTVRLPLLTAPARPAAAAAPPAPAIPRHRILVVDDNRDAARSLGLLLRTLGADVEVAHGGEEALDRLGGFRPSVVMLDLGMPGMDGFEVAARVRRRPEWDDVAIIALTGWGQEHDRRRTTAAGFDHHLVKPADLASLKSLLGSLPAGAG